MEGVLGLWQGGPKRMELLRWKSLWVEQGFFLVGGQGQKEEWISDQRWKYLLVIHILTSGRQLERQVWTLEELET